MASFSVPCPKVSPLLPASSQPAQRRHCVASFPRSDSRSTPALTTTTQFQQGCSRSQSDAFKVCAQLSQVVVEKVSNATPALERVPILESEKPDEVPDASSVSTFMNQVSDLVKLVDSKDIVELQLKQLDCEILIRKKEALPQPSIPAPVYFTPPPTYQSELSPSTPAPASVASRPSSPTSAPAPTKSKSSCPPFKCPMAGNFYRSPAPGAPPFVKVGDKVQKGQVICIIEAMKLMNDIEADHSGTVVEILVDDGKPVSLDMPLFIIEP
ncbi:biotin carboxyl carrier protein of acetyl-CoA carboxylase 2, chloroplastic-like isoform X2 [Salvia miltiorrhiza]|uniref:biotin carboxyl carrier protein of acetyl-CoA carboxylase 2, chloroplastic-like isoform X2 n=1 Tax=Salvia miltiorrhiza TaxID=226208 RepID=UPI0025ACC23B|nr:biotin carboxyl carrier protein of acetyl-CoA carboxylase 2, chloroplastic-like isoform X2 [Salvia miltiorrhiza]